MSNRSELPKEQDIQSKSRCDQPGEEGRTDSGVPFSTKGQRSGSVEYVPQVKPVGPGAALTNRVH